MATPELKLKPEELTRVYVDITREEEQKVRIRCIYLEGQRGRKVTRKEYLEELIRKDIESVKGASLREVKARK